MGDDGGRPRIDFLVGESVSSLDAMSRVYSNLKSRVDPFIDGKEWDYTLPASLKHIGAMMYIGRGLYAIRTWMKRRKDSIVHIHNQRLGMILHLNDFSPSVVFCHDIIEYVMQEYWVESWYKAFIRLYVSGTMKADVVLTPSMYTAEDIKRHFPTNTPRLEVIYNGVDPNVFRHIDRNVFLRHFGLPDGRRYMLYVGSEQPRKNVPAVVRTFIRAQKEFPDLVLLKVGRADEVSGHPIHEQILRELSAAGLRERAVFINFVPDELMPAAYSAADVFVFPSLYEGFGLPVLEAMACGTPVIASNTTAIPELTADSAILVPPKDEDAILDGTLRILRDDAFASELSARGRRRAMHFNWDVSAKKLLEIYRRLDPRNR